MVHASMLLELNGVITKRDYSSGNRMGKFFLVIPFKLRKLQMHIARMMRIPSQFTVIKIAQATWTHLMGVSSFLI